MLIFLAILFFVLAFLVLAGALGFWAAVVTGPVLFCSFLFFLVIYLTSAADRRHHPPSEPFP